MDKEDKNIEKIWRKCAFVEARSKDYSRALTDEKKRRIKCKNKFALNHIEDAGRIIGKGEERIEKYLIL